MCWNSHLQLMCVVREKDVEPWEARQLSLIPLVDVVHMFDHNQLETVGDVKPSQAIPKTIESQHHRNRLDAIRDILRTIIRDIWIHLELWN